ncbi:MAG: flippase [Solirubrobacteraceae bacterium]
MNARKILVSIFFNYLGALTGALVGFIATPIVLHHLGKPAYGAWALIASLIGYSSLLDLGIGLTVMRFVAERAHLSDRDELHRLTSTALLIYSCAGLVIVVAGGIGAAPISDAFHLHGALRHDFIVALIIMSITLGVTFPGALYTGINQGFGKFREQNLLAMAQALIGTGVTIAIALMGGGLVPLAIGWTICVALGFVARVLYAARALGVTPNPRRFERARARSLMSISLWMFVINIAVKVIWNTDTVVIGSVLSTVAVAHYTVALGPATAVRALTDQFNSVTYTAAASLRAQDERAPLRRLLLEATRVVTSFIGPFLVLFLLWGGQFLTLWVGPSFASSAPTLDVLVVGMLATSVQATATQILLAHAMQRRIAVIAVCEAVANLTLSIVLAKKIGIEGVALGTTIPTAITAFGYYLPRAAHLVGLRLHDVLGRLVRPSALCLAAYALLRFVLPAITYPSLIVLLAVAVAFVGTMIVTGVLLDGEERGTYLAMLPRRRSITGSRA